MKNGVLTPPRNKKLYTFPFNFLHVISSDGGYADFKYELFFDQNCNFNIDGAMGLPPEISLTPNNYANRSDTLQRNYNFSLTVKNFPQCSWTTDTFKAWLAQNLGKVVVATGAAVGGYALANGILGAQAELLFDEVVPRINRMKNVNAQQYASRILDDRFDIIDKMQGRNTFSAGGSIAQSLAQITGSTSMPAQTHGTQKGTIAMALGQFGYHFYYGRIKDEYAQILDSYFDRFGYATHRTKIPNRNARPHWTYTKTIGCTITGTLPANVAEEICSIYNNGITFWRNGDEVGNYNLNNRPEEEED